MKKWKALETENEKWKKDVEDLNTATTTNNNTNNDMNTDTTANNDDGGDG